MNVYFLPNTSQSLVNSHFWLLVASPCRKKSIMLGKLCSGKNSRSNSLLLLNESLSEAGEAIKNMDKDDKEAMDEVQVQAIKFLAIVASKI